jgi:hypothetical protein
MERGDHAAVARKQFNRNGDAIKARRRKEEKVAGVF